MIDVVSIWPGDKGQFGPKRHLAFTLGQMRGPVVAFGVRRQTEAENIVQPKGRVDIKAVIWVQPHAHRIGFTGEIIDPVSGFGQRLVILTEVILVPQMHAGLIADLNRYRGVKMRGGALDDLVFAGVARIRVEIEKVDVLDPEQVWFVRQIVPDLIVNRA